MSINTYNNPGIPAVAMAFILSHSQHKTLSISKAMLVMPFIANANLLSYLANSNVNVISIEKLFIEQPQYFSKYNQLYFDNISLSLNAIQLLNELEIISFSNNHIYLKKNIDYEAAMGKRAKKIEKASKNIATLLEADAANLYLTLRITL